jgi:hypothetical protein
MQRINQDPRGGKDTKSSAQDGTGGANCLKLLDMFTEAKQQLVVVTQRKPAWQDACGPTAAEMVLRLPPIEWHTINGWTQSNIVTKQACSTVVLRQLVRFIQGYGATQALFPWTSYMCNMKCRRWLGSDAFFDALRAVPTAHDRVGMDFLRTLMVILQPAMDVMCRHAAQDPDLALPDSVSAALKRVYSQDMTAQPFKVWTMLHGLVSATLRSTPTEKREVLKTVCVRCLGNTDVVALLESWAQARKKKDKESEKQKESECTSWADMEVETSCPLGATVNSLVRQAIASGQHTSHTLTFLCFLLRGHTSEYTFATLTDNISRYCVRVRADVTAFQPSFRNAVITCIRKLFLVLRADGRCQAHGLAGRCVHDINMRAVSKLLERQTEHARLIDLLASLDKQASPEWWRNKNHQRAGHSLVILPTWLLPSVACKLQCWGAAVLLNLRARGTGPQRRSSLIVVVPRPPLANHLPSQSGSLAVQH